VNFGDTNPAFNIGNQGGNGTYNLSGGTINFTSAGGILTVGRASASSGGASSTGTLNISGGTLEVGSNANMVIGNNSMGGGAQTEGTVEQTGGILQVDNTANLYLQGYNKATYNLDGGILRIGGTSLNAAWTNFGSPNNGTYTFNLGGGTIQALDTTLNTSVLANLVGGTTSTIDTNTVGVTWGGVISGDGNLHKIGVGTLTLNGFNTYTGGTMVDAGSLSIGAAGSIASSSGVNLTAVGATLDISSGSQTIQDLIGVANSIVNLGSNTLSVGSPRSAVFAGKIQGTGGIIKQGGGTLTLDGQSIYTGNTKITDGTLQMGVADAIAPSALVEVQNDAVWDFGGAGKQHINGPSNNGAITIDQGGMVSINLGAQDEGIAEGAVTAVGSGGKVQVHAGNGDFDPTLAYPFLTGAGANGSMTVVSNDMPLLTPTASLSGNSFVLTFAKSGQTMAFLADTPNEEAIGSVLDPLSLSDPLYKQLATHDAGTITTLLDQLSGDFHASTKNVLEQDAGYLSEAALDRLSAGAGGASGGSGADLSTDAARPGRAAIWVQGYGHQVTQSDGSNNAGALDATTFGGVGGIDGDAGNMIAGIGGGYAQSNLTSDSRNASADVSSASVLAYAGGDMGPLSLKVGGSYSFDSVDSTRTVNLMPAQTLTASYNARAAQAFAELGADIGALEPFAGVNFINLATDGFTETGGSAALTVASSNQNLTYSTVGLRLNADMGGVALSGMAGWRHAFGDTTPTSSVTIDTPPVGYTVEGVPIAADAFVAQAGISAALGPSTTVGVAYTGQIASGSQDQGAKATAVVKF
jgi:autotransporter-associated beta strand protein